MRFWGGQLVGKGQRRLMWLSALVGVLLFALLNILLTFFWPSAPPASSGAASAPLHFHAEIIIINGIAAVLAIVIAPYLLRAFDLMQQRVARQNAELRSLRAIDSAINAEHTLQSLLEVAIAQAALAVDGEWGALWLFEDGASRHAANAFFNVPQMQQDALRAPNGVIGSLVDRARQSGLPQRRRELDAAWKTDPAAARLALRNAIAVPILSQGKAIGTFLIGNRAGTLNPLDGFTEEDAQLLAATAMSVSVAAQSARLLDETQQRGATLRALVARTGEAIAASSDAAKLMQILADEAAVILGCARVGVYAFDETGDQFLPLAAHIRGGSEHSAPDFFQQPLSMDVLLPPANVPVGEAVPVTNIRDALGLPEKMAAFLAGPGYVFTLRSRDQRCIGLLCLLDEAPRAGTQETRDFALALAAQASVALENAQLAQQTSALLARMKALQAAAGQVAARLNAGEVLSGILESARTVLEADGCALWDRDSASGAWTRRAAYGQQLSAEGQPGASEAQLLASVLARRAPQMVSNTASLPIPGALAGIPEDVRALLGLPLLYAGQTLGVMLLSYRAPRAFIPDEVEFAQSFASQAAGALETARLFAELRAAHAREKRIAEAFQRSLLPPIPERVGRFEFAQKYQAGSDEAAIGGDFYDLFPLGEDRLGIVIADVSGKGLTAAVQTARVKYTLRGFAQEHPDAPGAALMRVNAALCGASSDHSGFVTLFYGILNTETGEMTYANAGHEPPIFLTAAREARPLDLTGGLALACFPEFGYPEDSVCFSPGDLLLLFTDGLSEARAGTGEFLGAHGVARLLAQVGGDAPTTVERMYSEINVYADNALRDDVAIMVVRCAA